SASEAIGCLKQFNRLTEKLRRFPQCSLFWKRSSCSEKTISPVFWTTGCAAYATFSACIHDGIYHRISGRMRHRADKRKFWPFVMSSEQITTSIHQAVDRSITRWILKVAAYSFPSFSRHVCLTVSLKTNLCPTCRSLM